jgi:putative transposase
MTPQAVHYRHAQALRDARQTTLDAAFHACPKRFKGRRPTPHALPTAAWIKPPPSQIAKPEVAPACTVNS